MKTLLSLFYLVFFLFIIEGCSSAQDMNSDAAKLYNKGNEYLRLGEYQKAIETYNQALIFQDDYRIYYQRGIALKKNGGFDEAAKSFDMCLKRKPDFAAGYNALGSVYFDLGKYQNAIDNFQKVLYMTESESIKEKVKRNIALAYTKLDNTGSDGNLQKGNDEFYVSSFLDTKAGEYPKKRDSFNKSEVPVIIVLGNKGKVVNIKVYSISSNKMVFDYSEYLPEQNINTYKSIPLNNLTPDSYKIQCVTEGVVIKTLFFSISN